MENPIDIEVLRVLQPLNRLDADGLAELGRKVFIEQLPAKRHLFVRGQRDQWNYYLLDGCVVLSQHEQIVLRLNGTDSAACLPLDPQQPRQLTATTQTPVQFIRVDRDLLELLLSEEKLPVYPVEELAAGSDATEHRLLHRLVHDFLTDKLTIPSLPELAIRIGRAVEDPNMDVARLARMIQYDAGIAARLIQVANSPLYYVDKSITTCRGAVEHLGFQLVRSLVLSYALQQLFQVSHPTLKRSMQTAWRHTSQVAAMSHLLARFTRHLDPDRAFLAGILYGIGALPIISHAVHYLELRNNAAQLSHVIEKLSNTVSSMILRKWGFGQDLVTTALESDVWLRDPSRHADYCDVVLLARLHQAVGTPRSTNLPMMDTIPAFRKVAGGQLGPQGSIALLENARQELQELEALLVLS